MAQLRRIKAPKARSHWIASAMACLLSLLILFFWISANGGAAEHRYLYWGSRVDCPGKLCMECGGLGHQESSLRCALEEALVLKRTFVLPARMCIVGKHNDKGLLGSGSSSSSSPSWEEGRCSMDSLYDLGLISKTVRVITDSSEEWQFARQKAIEDGSIVHIQGVPRGELSQYASATIINRTASPLAWFVECKDRKNRSAVLLSYSFLPSMAAQPLRDAAHKIRDALKDYDAMHVRRGDVLKTRKDGLGVVRTKFPHLDRDTQPAAIMKRISAWVPEGRTLYIASNEKRADYFDTLAARYKLARSSNFTAILEPVIHNNYQLFMVDRLVLSGARTTIQTFKESPGDLSLTDDTKKVLKWEKPVYNFTED